jgi:drug/metabolite transporter (DMT)-like permease
MSLTSRIPSVMKRVTFRAILCMIISAFCFSILEAVGQHFTAGITSYQVIWGRYAVHILFMVVVLGPRYKTKLVKTDRLGLQILRSMTMIAMPVCFLAASQYMPAHDIWAVYWTSPLVMLALAAWVLHEPVGLTRWIAGVIGFGAMLLVFRPDRDIISPAIVLAFGVGLSISLHLMLSRILRQNHPLTSLFHTALWVFVVLSFFVPLLWQAPTLRNVIGIIIIGLVGMVTLYVLARAGELAPIPIVAGFAYTEAISRLLINLLFFGVVPTRSAVFGTAIIVILIGYLMFHELHRPDAESESSRLLVPVSDYK